MPQGSTEFCNKSCRGEYCFYHNARFKNGYKGPRPCISCGIGMRGDLSLCYRCGGKNYRAVVYYYEKGSPVRKVRKVEPPSVADFMEVVV